MAPEFTEVLFSLLVSYVGAMELVFVVRSLYHWINQHQQLLDGGAENESLEEMQERIKVAIEEAKLQEFGDYKAMVDGVLYKDGFRVDPDTVAKEKEKEIDQINRQVIGKSRDSLEDKRQEVLEEPCVKKVIVRSEGQRSSKEPSPMPNRISSNTNTEVPPHRTPVEPIEQPAELLPKAVDPSIHFEEYERQAPDGEDHVPANQFSDEYLRSLDGIKNRRLVRDDGTGRRRSFKKRRSSDESISSLDSRKSREEEVQMFTSLEEEEFENMKRDGSDYVPIRYTNETSLKVSKPTKRYNKSPIKELTKRGDSKELVEEEADYDPWGEVKPEHYKDTQFWKREKNISIEEEQDEDDINARIKSVTDLASSSKAAIEPTTSRRVPKESSFEEATSVQNQEAIVSLQKIGSRNSELNKSDDNSQNKNVSKQNDYASLESFMAAERRASFDPTEINENACGKITPTIDTNDQKDDQPELVDSVTDFIQAEVEHYDIDVAFATISDETEQRSKDYGSNLDQKEEDPNDVTQPSGFYETTTSTMETDRSPVSNVSEYFDDWKKKDESLVALSHAELSGSSTDQHSTVDNQSPRTNATPEITKHVPTIQIAQSSIDKDDELEFEEPVLQGLSDFYDFNASINPPRSRSASRSRSRSKTPGLPPIPPSRRSRSRSPSPVAKPKALNFDDIEGVSHFLDFNVKLNRESYDPLNVFLYRNLSQTSDDFLLEQIRLKEPKGATKKNFDLKLAIKNKAANFRPGSPSLLSPTSTPMTPPTSSTTPSRRRSSVFEREIEFIRRHQRSAFEKDDEFPDNYEDYDELSEDAYRFRRSRSQSRSVSDISDLEVDEAAGGSELPEKILAEIARTTINYQDFSKELNAAFSDNEQIVEDSMTAQPEIVIQIDTNRRRYSCDDEEFMNRLEDEEYHHFRRYSLRQEYIEEEYPEGNEDYAYLQQIRHENRSKSLTPSLRSDYTELSDQPEEDKSFISTTSESELQHVVDADDSGSEDERQTVVGADDDIGGDVWNGASISENQNYIQSDEETRADVIYENGNLNEGDWKEQQGAVGGAETVVSYNSETSLQIEEIYNEVVENLEESQIETDYDNIFNQVKDEVISPNDDAESVKTEDLLEEILNEPNDVSATISSSRLLDHERLSVSNRKSPLGRRRSPFLSRTSKFVEKERSPSLKRISPSRENDRTLPASGRAAIFTENEQRTSHATIDFKRSPSASRTSSDRSDFIKNELSSLASRASPDRTDFLDNERSPSAAKTGFLENGRSLSTSRTSTDQTGFLENERSPSAPRTDLLKSTFLENERSPSASRSYSGHAAFLENERSPSTSRTYSGHSSFLENERSPSASRVSLSQTTFLENERSPPSGTTRTRLRTRYGISSTSYAHAAYEYNESSIASTEITYEPKKEYNWRKNFRLDDENSTNVTSDIPNVVTELIDTDEDNDKEVEDTLQVEPDSLDDRKFSMGGESITLYSRTPDRLNDFLPESEKSCKLDDLVENDSFDQDEPMPNFPKEEASNGAKDVRKEKRKKKGRKASIESSEGVTEVAALNSLKRENEKLSEETSKKKSSSKAKRRKSVGTVGDENRDGAVGGPKRKSPKRSSPVSSKESLEAQSNQSQQKVETIIEHTFSNQISSSTNKSATTVETPPPVDSSLTPESSFVADKPEVNPPVDFEPLDTASSPPEASASTSSTSNESSNSTRNRPPLERKESSGAYELIKDGSMYPWF